MELLHKCFPSQRGRDWWDDEVFLGLARLRGMECRARYAEAFRCAKSVIVPAAFVPGNPQEENQMNIVIDPDVSGDELRQQLYAGNLVVLTRLQALNDFVDYTREELTELFSPHDPEHVHEHIDPPRWPRSWARGSPASSIRSGQGSSSARSSQEAGFPAEDTHYDLPKPRTSFPVGHLTTGVAFAFPWHRDTWYSAPAQQINWWLPIFPVREDNAMGFDLASFDRAVPNTSDTFDYYQNNASRLTTATGVTRERAGPSRAR